MIHRMLVLIVALCLLGGCSGDEAATDGRISEQSQTMAVSEPGETPARSDDAVVEPSGALADTVTDEDAGADTVRVESVEDAGEPPAVPAGSGESVESESAVEPNSSTESGVTASSRGLRVLRAYVCKGIEQSEPTEAGKSFIPEDGVVRLCCFSEIAGAAGPDTVFHVWRWGDREMARVSLEVKSARWRTWSTKRILDEWRGEWHVDVTDRDGFVLTRLEFAVE